MIYMKAFMEAHNKLKSPALQKAIPSILILAWVSPTLRQSEIFKAALQKILLTNWDHWCKVF